MNFIKMTKKIFEEKKLHLSFIVSTALAFGMIVTTDTVTCSYADANSDIQPGFVAVDDAAGKEQARALAKKVEKQKRKEAEDKALVSFMRKINPKVGKTTAKKYVGYINNASKKYKVDKYWITAMIWKESTFQNLDEGTGSLGLMQMLGSTGKLFKMSKADLMNPKKNVDVGVRYLSKLIKSFDNNVKLGTLAYNQGSSSVRRGAKTSYYVQNVTKKYNTIKSYVNNYN